MDVVAVLTRVVQEQQASLRFQQNALKEQWNTLLEQQEMIFELKKGLQIWKRSFNRTKK